MEVKKGYKQTERGIIPEDWKISSIGDIASVTAGGTPSRRNPSYWTGSIPWITTSQIDFNTINEAEQYITEDGLKHSAAKLLPQGTLLMALYGQGKTRGKIAILGINAATNQACAAITLNHNISKKYVFHQIASQYDKIRNLSNTGNQENLNGTIVKSILILLPSSKEQTAIANALNDIDKLITSLEKLIAKKRNIKQGTMQQLLTGKKRLPGFSGKWENKKLREIGEITGAGVDKKSKPEEVPVRLVNYLDVFHRDFIYSNELNHWVTASPAKAQRCAVRQGDIFFTPSSETREDIGFSAVATEDIPDTAYSYHVVRLRLFDDWDLVFRTYIFKTRYFLDQAETICEGSGKRYVISLTRFREMDICYPTSKDEQNAISRIIFDMDAEIKSLEQKRDKYKLIKQGMMQELLTGKTRLI